MSAVTSQAVNKLLAKGVRNLWYPICPSHFLGEKPVSLRRLGLKVVLWRDETGASVMLEDRCPHRGAPLSMGMPMGDRIAQEVLIVVGLAIPRLVLIEIARLVHFACPRCFTNKTSVLI